MPRDDEELYEHWKKERASRGEPPAAFGDEVMGKIELIHASRQAGSMAALVAFTHSRLGRVTMGTFAAVAFIYRVTQVLSVFIAQ